MEEPRASPDLVQILPTSGVEEPELVAVEAMASAPTEARAAAIERAVAPEFASEPYLPSGSTEVAREVETTVVDRVAAADEMRAEGSGEFSGESLGSAVPYPRPLEPTAAESATGLSPATPAEEAVRGPIRGEPEPASQAPSLDQALPSEANPVHQISEKPANPRRGWWQRLIPS